MIPAETAETEALQALMWLMAQEDLFAAFLGQSGASVDDLKGAAADPAFLAAVVDFLLQDDATVMAVTAALGLTSDRLMQVRAGLPGGDLPHWT